MDGYSLKVNAVSQTKFNFQSQREFVSYSPFSKVLDKAMEEYEPQTIVDIEQKELPLHLLGEPNVRYLLAIDKYLQNEGRQ